MKRRQFVQGLSAASGLLFLSRLVQAETKETLPLEAVYPDYPSRKKYEIKRPGKYAIDEDVIQRKLSGAGHVGPRGIMLDIYCGSVEFDLQRHTFGADVGMGGVALSVKTNREYAEKFPKQGFTAASLDNRFVTLRNGNIDLARGKDTLTGILFSNEWRGPEQQMVTRPQIQTRLQGVFKDIDLPNITYTRNDYRFEQLKILTNAVAMSVEGSHTVIRDCIIESAGNAAVFIAGPNVTIENCEIRLRKFDKRVGEMYSSSRAPRAAIVLRDGSNAIIRNNRIRIDYGGEDEPETHGILVRDGATDVLIEGNTFINIQGEPVTLTDGAQAIVRDNKQEKRWLPF